MRRLVLILSLALVITGPGIIHAQVDQSDQQNPGEYNEDDSQPLKIASYFIAPVGFLLEWTVARPLNYLATRTPLAPVINPEYTPKYPPTTLADLPPPDKFAAEPYQANPSKAKIPVSPKVTSGSASNSASPGQAAMH